MSIVENIPKNLVEYYELLNKEIISIISIGIVYLFRKFFKSFFGKLACVPAFFRKMWNTFLDYIANQLWERVVRKLMIKSLEDKFDNLNNAVFVNSQKIDNVIRENQASQSEVYMLIDEMKVELDNVVNILKGKR